MLNKHVNITNPETIKKLESLETALDLKSPKIVDRALDAYIIEISKQRAQQSIELSKQRAQQSIIDTFISQHNHE